MSDLAGQLRTEIDNQLGIAGFERVIDVCKRALVAARKHEDLEGEAVALYGLAAAHRYIGQYDAARVFNEEGALRIARDLRDGQLIVDSMIQSAEIKLMGSLQYYDAREDYREALGVAHVMGYGRGLAAAMIGLAEIYVTLELLPLARNYAREGLEFARELALPAYQARALNVLGKISARERDAEMSLQCHQHALAISREYGLRLLETSGLYHIGLILAEASADSGMIYLQQALKLAQHTRNIEEEFLALGAIGDVCLKQRNFIEAQSSFDAMLGLATRTENRAYEANTFLHLGRLALAQGEFDRALNQFNQTLSLARERTNPMGEAIALEWLATAHSAQHNYGEALDALQQARSVYLALEDAKNANRIAGQIVLTIVLGAWDALLRILRVRR